jgi:hypothetical protein
MARFGFVGGGYQLRNVNANCQRCQNFIPETDETGNGVSMASLSPTWGMANFARLPGAEVRGMYFFNGRLFVVTDKFYEVFANGTFTGYSFLPDDGQPVTMAANNAGQLLICAAGQLWMFPLVQPVSAPITTVEGITKLHGVNVIAISCGTATITASSPVAIVQGTPNPNTLAITCGTLTPQASANITTVQGIIAIYNKSGYLAVTLTSMPFVKGQQVYFAGLTNATWLNGYSAIITSISGNTFYSTGGGWLNSPTIPPWPFGPTADTGTAALPSVINGTMPFAVGQTVTFSGMNNSAWLNGHTAVISSISGNTFYSTSGSWTTMMAGGGGSVQFPYGPAPDTGTAQLQQITTTMPFSVGQTVYLNGLTNATWTTWLNGCSVVISSISGGTIYGQAGSWVNSPIRPAFPFSPIADTGTAATASTEQVTSGIIGPVSSIAFIDGYFMALLANSQQAQWSALEDALTWDSSNTFKVSYYPDNVVAMMVNQRNIWFFGPKQTVIYWDSGDLLNPFTPIDGAFFEYGLAAQWSVAKLNNGLFWIGQDERGWAVAFRSVGWTPQRISTHAIEQEWNDYPTVSDAIAYSMQTDGHELYHVYFPTANKSWRYDAVSGLWHEPCFWNGTNNVAHHSRVYVFAFNKHLLGDTQTGHLYVTDPTLLTDDVIGAPNNPIRRLRRAPHIVNGLEWLFHHRLRVHLEAGLGPIPALLGTANGQPFVVLTDANGQQWMVMITDAGIQSSSTTSNMVPSSYIFKDLVNPSTTYVLGVSIAGALTLTPTIPPAGLSGFIQRLPMMTQPSGLQTSVSVQNGALVVDAPTSPTREPQVMLRWSDDGGHSWSNEYAVGAGFAGEFSKRVEWRRLGRSRDRVYEISVTDPIPWRIVDAYLDATDPKGSGSYTPRPRYAHEIGKTL